MLPTGRVRVQLVKTDVYTLLAERRDSLENSIRLSKWVKVHPNPVGDELSSEAIGFVHDALLALSEVRRFGVLVQSIQRDFASVFEANRLIRHRPNEVERRVASGLDADTDL